MSPSPSISPPTAKQLAYLKALAERTATTFTYPHTSTEASREIDRLKQLKPLTADERALARRAIDGDRERHTTPQPPSRRRSPDTDQPPPGAERSPPMTTATISQIRPRVPIGERVELARYAVGAGERIVYGQRVNGVVRFQVAGCVVVGVLRRRSEDGRCRRRGLGACLAVLCSCVTMSPMTAPSDYLAERGFVLKFSHHSEDELEAIYLREGRLSRAAYRRLRKSGAVGPVLAELHASNNAEFVVRSYGTGATEAEAALRAMKRWTGEQGD